MATGALLACTAVLILRGVTPHSGRVSAAGIRPEPSSGLVAADQAELVLGQSLPLTGPSAQLGLDYQRGAMAWFDEINRKGVVHGRHIRLVSLDDQYEPEKTLRNTETLHQRPDLLALFGYVGTPEHH